MSPVTKNISRENWVDLTFIIIHFLNCFFSGIIGLKLNNTRYKAHVWWGVWHRLMTFPSPQSWAHSGGHLWGIPALSCDPATDPGPELPSPLPAARTQPWSRVFDTCSHRQEMGKGVSRITTVVLQLCPAPQRRFLVNSFLPQQWSRVEVGHLITAGSLGEHGEFYSLPEVNDPAAPTARAPRTGEVPPAPSGLRRARSPVGKSSTAISAAQRRWNLNAPQVQPSSPRYPSSGAAPTRQSSARRCDPRSLSPPGLRSPRWASEHPLPPGTRVCNKESGGSCEIG